ncbi:hypothetical protein HYN59_04875 [Flavobacterium album]|uniref:Outer membrane protein beta-barrel domain-containing protein n=1 Tax=Flavobacterium album TaxID=2175091 RepID=A0A2S1QW77_9FLAO|nr:outer membrane beta-barrel protein [Flavobacterium album]AWH84491.1 hypothetical protein HYN59_04875 [Flavobacterium album]
MNEQKNIDRLFREKFKDFEVAPPEFVWENIEEVLREKKKRRVIPLWIRLSGVAAVLVAGTFFMSPYYSGTNTNENPVVIDKNGNRRIYPTDNPVQNHETIIGKSQKDNNDLNTAVASGENASGNKGGTTNGIGTKTENTSAEGPENNTAFGKTNNAVAHDDKSGAAGNKRNNRTHTSKNIRQAEGGLANEAVAQSSSAQKNKPGKNKTNRSNRNNNAVQGLPEKSGSNENAIAAGSEKNPAKQAASQNASVQNKAGQETGIIKKDIPTEGAIANAPVDTTAVQVPENELEKLLQEKLNAKKDSEKALADNSNKGKWNIKPQLAPIFYNSLSQGSPIGGEFAGNSKSFDNDLSYGIGIDYAVNDRLSIRSGINTVNLNYSTNDIQFSASLNDQTSNVSANARTANIVVTPRGQQPIISNPNVAFTSMSDQSFNGSMVQKTGYIEVPVEMSYALLNKKFGIDVIGGMSTLFLNENNVSVVSTQGYSTDVGQAQNLNSIHFSTNVGLGFKYRFWKSFQANFEPTFKYQVNAYSRDAGNFKPYFIGLYSGISFSF